MMFNGSFEIAPYDFIKPMTTLEIAKIVYSEMREDNWKKRRLTKRKAIHVLLEGNFPGQPPWISKDRPSDKMLDAYKQETGKDINDETADPKIRNLYYKTCREEWAFDKKLRLAAAKAFLEGFWPRVKGMKVFHFEYSDNEGQSPLEHGDIFHLLPHVRISKH